MERIRVADRLRRERGHSFVDMRLKRQDGCRTETIFEVDKGERGFVFYFLRMRGNR